MFKNKVMKKELTLKYLIGILIFCCSFLVSGQAHHNTLNFSHPNHPIIDSYHDLGHLLIPHIGFPIILMGTKHPRVII